MAVIAAMIVTVVPQLEGAATDTEAETAAIHLRLLRQKIEDYQRDHGGRTPDARLEKLLIQTDRAGNPGEDYGPYLRQIPINPFTGSTAVTTDNPSDSATFGWRYDPITSHLRATTR